MSCSACNEHELLQFIASRGAGHLAISAAQPTALALASIALTLLLLPLVQNRTVLLGSATALLSAQEPALACS